MLIPTYPDTYTPGYAPSVAQFMAARSAETHAAFFLSEILPGDELLDCGCGPGTITLGLAEAAFPGHVFGLDIERSQLEQGEKFAWGREILNARFLHGDAYELPFRDCRFDLVYSHALLEHLGNPEAALKEMLRVLKPGGKIGVCVPDWDAFEIHPFTPEVARAIAIYRGLQEESGGTTKAAVYLQKWLQNSGFQEIAVEAHLERYEDPAQICDYLGFQLTRDGCSKAAGTLRKWSEDPEASFIQAWRSAVARRPG